MEPTGIHWNPASCHVTGSQNSPRFSLLPPPSNKNRYIPTKNTHTPTTTLLSHRKPGLRTASCLLPTNQPTLQRSLLPSTTAPAQNPTHDQWHHLRESSLPRTSLSHTTATTQLWNAPGFHFSAQAPSYHISPEILPSMPLQLKITFPQLRREPEHMIGIPSPHHYWILGCYTATCILLCHSTLWFPSVSKPDFLVFRGDFLVSWFPGFLIPSFLPGGVSLSVCVFSFFLSFFIACLLPCCYLNSSFFYPNSCNL